ncbi:MAG: hypothetical protein ABSG36_10415 [Acidimicrobiales bacterium]|jgi:hypothetical protein
MTRALGEYLQRSRRARTAKVSEARAVLDQVYGMAGQVIEGREQHNLSQVESAEKAGSSVAL